MTTFRDQLAVGPPPAVGVHGARLGRVSPQPVPELAHASPVYRSRVGKTVVDVYRVPLAGPARSGCADAALERILAHQLGHAPRIVRGEHGKPRLAEGALAFNVAHSGTWAVIAIAPSEVGIDIEQHRPLDAAVLAARYFTPAEAAAVRGEPALFFRVWARKEAWLKARGVGVLAPLNEVDVRGAVAGWFVEDLPIAPGYSAAVAAPVPSLEIRLVDGP